MIQEIPYGTYIEMQTYSNDSNIFNNFDNLNNSNDLPISIVIVPNQTHKVIESAIVHRVISCKCQIIIIFIMTLPVTLLLLSVMIPKFVL
jgi:hypothetical protein